MAQIGSFGSLIFEVSTTRTVTPPSISESGGARWNTHDVAGAEPVQEYNGPTSRTITIPIVLLAQMGADVEEELSRIESMSETGEAHPLIIGGKPKGGAGSYWAITSWSTEHDRFGRAGNTTRASVELSFLRVRSVNTPQAVTSTVAKKSTQKKKR